MSSGTWTKTSTLCYWDINSLLLRYPLYPLFWYMERTLCCNYYKWLWNHETHRLAASFKILMFIFCIKLSHTLENYNKDPVSTVLMSLPLSVDTYKRCGLSSSSDVTSVFCRYMWTVRSFFWHLVRTVLTSFPSTVTLIQITVLTLSAPLCHCCTWLKSCRRWSSGQWRK